MASAIPLKFEFDATTPSSLAEFTAANTVSVINGGTGVSSLELLGASLSSIDLSSTWLSATNITATNVSATTVSATYIYAEKGVSSTTLSSTYVIASTAVSSNTFTSPGDGGNHFYMKHEAGATYPNLIEAEDGALTIMAATNLALRSSSGESRAMFRNNGASELYYNNAKKLETHDEGILGIGSVSATTVSSTYQLVEGGVSATSVSAAGGFVPTPYGWVAFTTAGTPSDTEQNIGIGSSKAENISSADDFVWDDTNKRFDVVKAGTYEFTLNVALTVAATTTVTLQLYTTVPGSSNITADVRVHSSIDPVIVSLNYVGAIAGGGYAFATTTDDGSEDVTVQPGTTMTIKRLK